MFTATNNLETMGITERVSEQYSRISERLWDLTDGGAMLTIDGSLCVDGYTVGHLTLSQAKAVLYVAETARERTIEAAVQVFRKQIEE